MEKRFKNGLVLGKFMPVHNGHIHLIREAQKQCEKVYVMVCSIESEPINGRLRYNWVYNIFVYDEDIKVMHCEDENPQYEHECDTKDEFYSYWTKSVYDRIPKLDAVFTSEDYGDDFAEYLGIEHVLVDKERKTYPVSGTMIRENPYENWAHVPTEVRGYFLKRICILGPESVGKSTMVKKLADYYDTVYVEEYGREYTETVVVPEELDILDFGTIVTKQLTLIHDVVHIPETNKVVFVDTDAITTFIFAEMFLPDYPKDELRQIFEGYIDVQKEMIDFYILLDVDVPWINDGTRQFPEGRKEHFNRIKEELDRQELPYIIVSGEDYEKRFTEVVEKVNEIMDEPLTV